MECCCCVRRTPRRCKASGGRGAPSDEELAETAMTTPTTPPVKPAPPTADQFFTIRGLARVYRYRAEPAAGEGGGGSGRTLHRGLFALWLLFLALMLAFLGVTCVLLLVEFLSYRTMITTREAHDMNETFPHVTLCSHDPLNVIQSQVSRRDILGPAEFRKDLHAGILHLLRRGANRTEEAYHLFELDRISSYFDTIGPASAIELATENLKIEYCFMRTNDSRVLMGHEHTCGIEIEQRFDPVFLSCFWIRVKDAELSKRVQSLGIMLKQFRASSHATHRQRDRPDDLSFFVNNASQLVHANGNASDTTDFQVDEEAAVFLQFADTNKRNGLDSDVENARSSEANHSESLRQTFFSHTDEILPASRLSNIRVGLTNDWNYVNLAKDGVSIEKDKFTELTFKISKWHKQDSPNEPCTRKPPKIGHAHSYSRDFCRLTTLNRIIYSQCKCYSSEHRFIDEASDNSDIIFCNRFRLTHLEEDLQRINCMKSVAVAELLREIDANNTCPLPCKYRTYVSHTNMFDLNFTKQGLSSYIALNEVWQELLTNPQHIPAARRLYLISRIQKLLHNWFPAQDHENLQNSTKLLNTSIKANEASQARQASRDEFVADSELYDHQKNRSTEATSTMKPLMNHSYTYAFLLIRRENFVSFEYTENYMLTITALLSRIGGLSSLTLGITLATIFEMIEYLAMRHKFCQDQRNNKKQKQQKTKEAQKRQQRRPQSKPQNHCFCQCCCWCCSNHANQSDGANDLSHRNENHQEKETRIDLAEDAAAPDTPEICASQYDNCYLQTSRTTKSSPRLPHALHASPSSDKFTASLRTKSPPSSPKNCIRKLAEDLPSYSFAELDPCLMKNAYF